MGLALAMSLLAVPLGAPLFSDGLKLGVTLSSDAGPLNLPLILGLLLSAAPLWVAVLTCVFLEARFAVSFIRGRRRARPRYGEVFSVFVQRAEVDLLTETIETPEPTSIEFEAVFKSLMEDALADSSHRLILVIDNLDRIDGAEALMIWSTLQTFLQHDAHGSSWLDRLWVIMPFDSGSISKLWQGTDTSGNGLSASFLDKTFQVRFDVPPATTSDWREYLLAELKAALPCNHDEAFQTVYRLVAVLFEAPTRAPTPRELKLIVNQIGALHRLRQHEVPLEHMAYYTLLCRLGKTVVQELLAGSLPTNEVAGLVGEGVRDSLAALALGVDPKRARQLLLEVPILSALAEPDAEALSSLMGASDGFAEVLEQAVERAGLDWPAAEAGKLLHAVVALTDSGLLDSGPEYRPRGLILSLVHASKRVSVLAPITDAAERGLVLLSMRSGDPQVAQRLFEAYAQAISATPPEQVQPRIPHRILAVVKQLHEAGFDAALAAGVAIPGGVDRYFAAIRELRYDSDPTVRESWHALKPQGTPEAITQALTKSVEAGQCAGEHVDSIQLLRNRQPGPTWEVVVAALAARLAAGVGAGTEEVSMLLGALLELRDMPSASAALKSLSSAGHLAHHLVAATGEAGRPTLARCVYVLGMRTPAFGPPDTNVGQSSTGHAQLRQHLSNPPAGLPESLAELLISYEDKRWLFAALDSTPGCEALVGRTASAIVELDQAHDFFAPSDVLEHWALFEEYTDHEKLVVAVGADGRLSEELRSREFDVAKIALVEALVASGPHDQSLLDWTSARLQEVSRDEWVEQLKSNGTLLRLAIACANKDKAVDLRGNFREAMGALAEDLAGGSPPTEIPWDAEKAKVFSLLDAANRNVLRDGLTGILERHPSHAPAVFFNLFGDEISADKRLQGNATLATTVLVPLLGARNPAGLAWVHDLLEADPALLSQAKPNHRHAFEGELSHALRDGADDDAQAAVRKIAATLGVKPAQPVESTEGTERSAKP